jgi:hypothetical protein
LIGIADAQGRLIYGNPAFQEALGFSKEELLEKPFTDSVSVNNPPAVLRKFAPKPFRQAVGEETVSLRARAEPICLSACLPAKSRMTTTGCLAFLGMGIAHDIRERLRESRHRLRVLLAEDNAVNQLLAVRLLEKHGHSVTVAANGREALEALSKVIYDVVLMDVQMPEMDGLEATTVIREREKKTGEHIPSLRSQPTP